MIPYRHYKGGRYAWLCQAATHNHNGDLDVVYISLTHGTAVTRPLERDSRNEASWNDPIEWPDGVKRCRFMPEAGLRPAELEACGFMEKKT
jgi:hypothetical protein